MKPFVRWLALWLTLACPASAQVGISYFPGPGMPTATGYQGPGDVQSGAYAFYSCARAYNAAYANGTNPMCDLVDLTTGAVAICTLRVKTNGFADLVGTYCTGSTTPSAACAAAAGGSCRVSKAYDQSGNARDITQGTTAAMPRLTFSSSPTGTLPVMTMGTSGEGSNLTGGSFTVAQPITLSGVYIKTAGAAGAVIGSGSTVVYMGSGTVANTAAVYATTEASATANTSAWHALQGLLSGTGNNCAINVDSSDTAGLNCGTTGFSAVPIRIGRSGGGAQLTGSIAEAIMYASTSDATFRSNLATNQRSAANGYNF